MSSSRFRKAHDAAKSPADLKTACEALKDITSYGILNLYFDIDADGTVYGNLKTTTLSILPASNFFQVTWKLRAVDSLKHKALFVGYIFNLIREKRCDN